MTEVKFDLKPVKKKLSRKYRKGSKYDPILEAFIEGTEELVQVFVEGKDAKFLQIQLEKRINSKKLENKIKVSVVHNNLYLEKL